MLACGFPDDGLEDELRGVHNDITRLGIHSFFFFFFFFFSGFHYVPFVVCGTG